MRDACTKLLFCLLNLLLFLTFSLPSRCRIVKSIINEDAVKVASKSVLLAADVIEFATLGSLSNDDGDDNENHKKHSV